MPLVHISLRAGKPAAYREKIADSVYRAMWETLNVPEGDKFIVITEHTDANFYYDNSFDITRSDDLVYIQVTLFDTRATEQKKLLFRRIAELLSESPGIRLEDVFVNLLESARENWSVGKGVAQFADGDGGHPALQPPPTPQG